MFCYFVGQLIQIAKGWGYFVMAEIIEVKVVTYNIEIIYNRTLAFWMSFGRQKTKRQVQTNLLDTQCNKSLFVNNVN